MDVLPHAIKFMEISLYLITTLFINSPFINSDWKAAHHNAAISLENREEKLDEVYNQIERNLDLLGATAIEDKLQVCILFVTSINQCISPQFFYRNICLIIVFFSGLKSSDLF